MPKQDIRMTEAQIDAFLSTQSTAIVVTKSDDAAPWGSVGRLLYQGGRVAFSVHDDDPVVVQLAADGRACCVVEEFPSYYEIKGVMVHGRVSRRAISPSGEATYDLEVHKVTSFDFGKLLAVGDSDR